MVSLPTRFALLDTKADDSWLPFSGVASTGDIDIAQDILAPGCFGAVDPDSVAMLRFHGPSLPVGRWEEFRLTEGALLASGAAFKGTSKGQEAAALLINKVINALSVGFRALKHSWDRDHRVRTITTAELIEVSLVSTPANRAARITHVEKSLRHYRRPGRLRP
jgi:HK97 family phage prohead protease